MYREVLRSSEEHKNQLKTDSLQVEHYTLALCFTASEHPSPANCSLYFVYVVFIQRLHATHNLMELLNAKHPGIPPTLRDGRLKEEVC